MTKGTKVIVIAWVIAGFVLLAGYWASTWRGWDWQALDWQVLTGFATWLLAGGIGIAIWQIVVMRESANKNLEATRQSTNARIAMDLFRELRSEETVEKFRHIDNIKPGEDAQTVHTIDLHSHTIDLHSIDYVLARLDFLGVLVGKEIIDKRLAIDGYAGVTALRCWYALHQYIHKVRHDRGYFGDNFEAFANCSMEYFHEIGTEVAFSNPYVTIEDLVEKLKGAKDDKDETTRKLYPRSLDEIRKQGLEDKEKIN